MTQRLDSHLLKPEITQHLVERHAKKAVANTKV